MPALRREQRPALRRGRGQPDDRPRLTTGDWPALTDGLADGVRGRRRRRRVGAGGRGRRLVGRDHDRHRAALVEGLARRPGSAGARCPSWPRWSESVTRLTLNPASWISWVASASVLPTTSGTFSGPSDQNRVTFEPSATWVPAGGLHLDDLVLGVVGVALGQHHPQALAAQLVGGVVLVLADHVGQRAPRACRRRRRSRPCRRGRPGRRPRGSWEMTRPWATSLLAAVVTSPTWRPAVLDACSRPGRGSAR